MTSPAPSCLESPGSPRCPTAAEDPLAALDQLDPSDESDDGLTFHDALVRAEQRHGRDEGAAKAKGETALRPAAPAAAPPSAHPPLT